MHQLNLITKVVGSPSEEDLQFIHSEKARRYIRSLPHHPRASRQDMYPNCSTLAIDLISRMLVFDPSKRITVEQALEHPYLASLHDISDEPCAQESFEFNYETEKLNEEAIRELVFKEALEMHPETQRGPITCQEFPISDPGKTAPGV